MAEVIIALGSNLGDRLARLREAVAQLSSSACIKRVSRVYETAPMYVTEQPAFLNGAVLAEVDIGPISLLKHLKNTEKIVGRNPALRFGPREIDLDLISYGALGYRFRLRGEDRLMLPHPRVVERRFVLQPLFDLNPELVLPGLGSVRQMLDATEEQASSVIPIENASLSL